MKTRDFEIPLQNGSVAILPVPMTPADHAFLLKTLEAIKPMHVWDLPVPLVCATCGELIEATCSCHTPTPPQPMEAE